MKKPNKKKARRKDVVKRQNIQRANSKRRIPIVDRIPRFAEEQNEIEELREELDENPFAETFSENGELDQWHYHSTRANKSIFYEWIKDHEEKTLITRSA